MILRVVPVIDPVVRGLCVRPYPGHPRGCPNYGRKKSCPPGARMFESRFDIDKPVYALVNRYDLGSHIREMKERHPNWSPRQLACCLYWQPAARRQLMALIEEFLRRNLGYSVTATPEGMGVDVTTTLARAGLRLPWPPVTEAYQVAIAGVRLPKQKEGAHGKVAVSTVREHEGVREDRHGSPGI